MGLPKIPISLKSRLIVSALLLLFVSCAKKTEIKATWFHPIKMDGTLELRMDTFSDQPSFSGDWSAPRLGEDGRFFRSLQQPGGSILFLAPRKEGYVLHLLSQAGPGGFSIALNGKLMPVSRGEVELVLDSDLVEAGENTLHFQVDGELRVFSVTLYPQRIWSSPVAKAAVSDPDSLFLPGALRYYLKPLPGEELVLCLDLGRVERMGIGMVIRTSDRTLESKARIESGRDFRIRPVPGEFQEILVIPKGEPGGLIKIKRSLLVSPFGAEDGRKLKKAARDKNVLIICLDAARSDHVGFNGYARPTTPNIDRLAGRSLVFRNAHSEAAYTLASSATLLTGLPPDSHNVLSAFFSSLRPDLVTIAELFHERGYFTAAMSANPYFGKAYRLDRGFDEFRELFVGKRQVLAEEFVDPFREIIGDARGRPFFVCLHIREPHQDYLMPPPYLGRFQNSYLQQTDEFLKIMHEILGGERNSPADLSLLRDLYDENLSYADSVVGRILRVLEERGAAKQTITIITADHGECLGEHGLVGHNVILFEEGIHIPLIVRIPGLRPQVSERPAITSDMVVTLAELFELGSPQLAGSRGESLFRLGPERRRFCRALSSTRGFPGYAVEHYPYKLVVWLPDSAKKGELYDVENDPQERTELEGHELVKETLLFYLFDYLKAAEKGPRGSEGAKLREKDLEQLRSLGYIK
jgi:uncharacterized sulfatase